MYEIPVSSSLRTQGPIATGARGYDKSSNSFLKSIDHAVWVPAFRRHDGLMVVRCITANKRSRSVDSPSSSLRTQGPIATGARGYDKSSNSFLKSIDLAVWVPAFAGTTC
jgi:hypothetical protein